jgi:hypothetical protein
MRFLRTASTGRLLATILGVIAAIGLGTAIAVAASGPGPVPRSEPLAQAIHGALSATAPAGVTARVTFTNNLISSADFTGGPTDPILQGASGRLWLTKDKLRVELQSSNGDSQILVSGGSFWVSDPASQTVYEGKLSSSGTSAAAGRAKRGAASGRDALPTVARIQAELTKLAKRVNLSGAIPTDVAGQASYRLEVSPRHDGGLLGKLALAWDAVRGVPLDFAIYARGDATPVIELKVTDISYGAVPASDFSVSPPSGYTVIKVASGSGAASGSGSASGSRRSSANPTAPMAAGRRARAAKLAGQPHVSGLAAVSSHVAFKLAAPASVVGLPRRGASLLDWGGHPAALLTYGQGLGGIAVIEQSHQSPAAGSARPGGSNPGGAGFGGLDGLSLPTVSINGVTGQELATALGTVIRFTSDGVDYTVIGSVPPFAAEQAARALIP